MRSGLAASYAAVCARPKLRAAVEHRSLDVAKTYYVDELGGTDYEEVGKPTTSEARSKR
jgi:hypothetical protein